MENSQALIIDSEEDMFSPIDSDSDDDYEFIANNSDHHQSNCTVLTESDIRLRQEDDIARLSTVLSIPTDSAKILLIHYNWIVSKVHDEWFADEEKVRNSVGLWEKPLVVSECQQTTCGICFEIYSTNRIMKSAGCCHPFCTDCWAAYIGMSIKEDGPGCLTLRCPHPSCAAAVGQDMVDEFVTCDEDKEKYSRYLMRSYVESRRKTVKWCPAPECDYAVEFVAGSGSYDVTCLCSYRFCWNCAEEAHRPVDCSTVAMWVLKNTDESENTNWILAYTKPCPDCKRPIQKNHGCMHMRCTAPCHFEFCWLCLGKWPHVSACNSYDRVLVETQGKSKVARRYIERYTHYYERWVANNWSKQQALADLRNMQNKYIKRLSNKQGLSETNLKFVLGAWQQIVECRRVLKWTYVYGYYLPEKEHIKKQFFEYLQGEAESALERLHRCAEKELQSYAKSYSEELSIDFNKFRIKLVELTNVTRNYFENLLGAMENGLSDVNSETRRKRQKVT